MENPQNKWRFLAGNIIYKWAIYTMAMYAFPALFLRPANCGMLRDHLMTATCLATYPHPRCSLICISIFTFLPCMSFHAYINHIWYIYIYILCIYIYIYLYNISLSHYKYLPYWVLFASASHHWGTQNCMVDTNPAWSQWAGRESRYHLSHDSHDAQNAHYLRWFHGFIAIDKTKNIFKVSEALWGVPSNNPSFSNHFQIFSDVEGPYDGP